MIEEFDPNFKHNCTFSHQNFSRPKSDTETQRF